MSGSTDLEAFVVSAAELAVQRAFERTLVPSVQHGIITVADTSTWIHQVQLDGQADSTFVHDVQHTGAAVGDRVTVLFAPPHQAYILGMPKPSTWQTYTPTFTNVTIGSGGIPGISGGRFYRDGSRVDFRAFFILGSAGDVTNRIIVSLPVTPANGITEAAVTAWATNDTGTVRYAGVGTIDSTEQEASRFVDSPTNNGWNATQPFDWLPGYQFYCAGTYEAFNG